MEQNNLVFDIGNSHIVMGFYRGGTKNHSWRVSTVRNRTEDEYYALIGNLLNREGIEPADIDYSALASVVPVLTRVFDHMLEKYFSCKKTIVTAEIVPDLVFPMSDPSFIGADLVVNAFAAREKYRTNCIVCDLGTATTLQLVGKDGYFHGTVIAPGLMTSSENLFKNASQLSNIKIEKPGSLLGKTTRDALLSGIVTGNALMLDGFITRIRNEYGHLGNITAIATGGIANLISDQSEMIDLVDKDLTLDGLNLIIERNRT